MSGIIINKEDIRFIAKRARLVKSWPFVGSAMLCVILGGTIWLFLYKPLIANPFAVLSMLKEASIPLSTLNVMAGLYPLLFLMCIFLIIVIVLLMFMAISIERKYMSIIQRINEKACNINQDRTELTDTAQPSNTDDHGPVSV